MALGLQQRRQVVVYACLANEVRCGHLHKATCFLKKFINPVMPSFLALCKMQQCIIWGEELDPEPVSYAGVQDVNVVSDDGSPHGRKTFVLWNPPLTASQLAKANSMSRTEGRARNKGISR